MSDIKIYGKLVNATTDNVLAGADLIYDGNQALSEINKLIPKLEGGLIPSKYLPSYVDDVLEGEFIDEVTFNVSSGEPCLTGVIYVDTTTNISYRWSGSKYIKISSPLELGTTDTTALKGSLGIKNSTITRTSEHVNIELIRYSGDELILNIPSATLGMAGIMSTSDKSIVNNASTLLSNSPLVDKLLFAVADNKRWLLYKNNGNSLFTGIEIPKFGEKLSVIADYTLTGSTACTINLLALDGSVIDSINIPIVNERNNGVMSPSMYLKLNNASDSILGLYSSILELNNSVITTYDVGYNSDSVDVNLLSVGNDPIEANIEAATTTKAGVLSATDKTKLDELDWYFEE